MKSKILSVAAPALMFAACNEPLNDAAEVETDSIKEEMPIENVVDGVSDKDVQFKKFAEILSRAVSQNKSVREFLKEKALEKIDNDYNVFYPIVRNEMIDGKSFESILTEYSNHKEEMKKVFEVLPLLNIHIPELVKQVEDFDTEDDEIPVLYNNELYWNGHVVDTLGVDEVPGFDVLVLTESTSIRKKTSLSKIAENSLFHGEYEYVDNIFNPKFVSKSLSKSEGVESLSYKYTSYYIDNNYVDDILLNAVKNSSVPRRATRAFIYYNMANQNQTPSTLRRDIKECVFRFKINGNALKSCVDAASANDINPLFNEDYTHTGGTVSRNEALQKLLAGNFFEIRFVLEKYEEKSYTAEDYFTIHVKPEDLFNLYIDEEKSRHKTWFRHSKYTYKIDYTKSQAKWYYPLDHKQDTRFHGLIWEFNGQPTNRRITIYVENPYEGETKEITDKISYTYTITNKTSITTTTKVSESLSIGITNGYDSSNSKTEDVNVKYTVPQNSKEVAHIYLDFFENYPLSSVYSSQCYPNSLSSGDFTMDILPISNSFFNVKYR